MHLYTWNPGPTQAPLILPVRENEAPRAAALRYLSELQRQPDLMELFEGRSPDLALENFQELSLKTDNKVLLLANLPKDYTQDSLRLKGFIGEFRKSGQDNYILPINADLGLTLSESREFLEKIGQRFSLMVAMGGDDTYSGSENTESIHSLNVNRTRDLFESKVIRSFIKAERGFFLGICRGSQLAARVLGYNINPDIPSNLPQPKRSQMNHANSWHPIHLQKTSNEILQKISQPLSSIGSQLSPQANTASLMVNSIHHQGVLWKPGGPLELSALAPDGTTEATEFKNGRGILMQFHPELMNNPFGRSMLKQLVVYKTKAMAISCEGAFRL